MSDTRTKTDEFWVDDACYIFDNYAKGLGWNSHIYSERLRSIITERDSLQAENELLKAQLEAAREMHPAEPGLLRKQLAQKREPSSDP